VDIYKDGKQYMSFGTELFTPHNNVENNVLSIVDNANLTLDDHYLTIGGSFERQYFLNQYLRYPYGYYRYASMEDFMNGAQPLTYGLTYGYNGKDAPGSELAFGMFGWYAQDEWSLSDAFRLTYGLRLDLPVALNSLGSNPAISALTFAGGRKIDVSQWPTFSWQVSPRVGFRWDVKKDRSILINGGTGLFTGSLPFVWFTNQVTNSGLLQNTLDPLTNLPEGFPFEPNYKDLMAKYPNLFPSRPSTKAPGSICVVDPDFKMPQVWRSSLGADIQLPLGFLLSLNALYTRDVYNVTQVNLNEKAPTGHFTGKDDRAFYTMRDAKNRDNRINTGVSSAMMLTNGHEKGYQYSLNAVLTKRFEHGFYGMISYTYTDARDLTANPGSTASSAWSSNTAVGSLNDPGLSYSSFAVPHRIVANLSYEINYANHWKTTLGLFYSGSNTGRMSYTVSNDLNGDGYSSDLLYVPASKDALLFTDQVNKAGEVTYSKEQQATDFWNYVQGNSYLRKHEGKYVKRYGDLQPWLNRFDFKVTQDFYLNLGKRRYGLQASLDILNVGNLLNSSWGIYKQNGLASYNNIRPLTYKGLTADNQPIYQVNAASSEQFKTNSEWSPTVTTNSTWGMLLGLKVLF
jgi:hypothetical protein